jgi:hypothetical protein
MVSNNLPKRLAIKQEVKKTQLAHRYEALINKQIKEWKHKKTQATNERDWQNYPSVSFILR